MLTQDDYKLWTGEIADYSESEWSRIVAVAGGRLAGLLGSRSLPKEMPDDLKMLFANFICLVIKNQGRNQQIGEKKLRNFTVKFSDGAGAAFANLKKCYGDLIEKYSQCGCGFDVEESTRECPYERF